MLNAVEPGTVVPIHRHPAKDESFVLLRGKVRVTIHNDDGTVKESVVLNPEKGLYGVDIPKGVWHKVESLESGSVFFECKEGPFVPHEEEGILEIVKSEKLRAFAKAVWQYCSYVYVPQWGRLPKVEDLRG